GWTKFAVREKNDTDNVAPSTDHAGFEFWASEQTGTSQDPYLDVTYSTSTPGGGAATSTGTGPIQDITYTYDADGNITKIINNSGTMAVGTTTYAYDDFNRLTQADLENAGTNPNFNVKN